MAIASVSSIEPQLTTLDPIQPHAFITPVKNINEGHDVSDFLMSRAYNDIMTFVLQLNKSMFPSLPSPSTPPSSEKILNWDLDSPDISFSETVNRLRSLLDDLHKVLDEVLPDPGPRRFGNASFRKWSQVVEERAPELLDRHLPNNVLSFHGISEVTAKSELEVYLLGSFGSPQRLDYGTGHELSFIAFLGCIWKLGGFRADMSGDEERGIVLGIFDPYLTLIRRLIKTYTLEPAGSHGVWGLDDHSFLPYLFGSAQYAPAISTTCAAVDIPTEGAREDAPDPAEVTKAAMVERERKKNLYFGAIGFIYDVKKGPFWEHSPMLFDISGVRKGWAKINKGMIKMYNAEVLSKFPVVQHFRFGSLFSWERDPNAVAPPSSIHTSNQPTRPDTTSSSLNQTSARSPPLPEAGTRAPWATPTATLPNPGVGTAAPWANGSAAAGGGSSRPPLQAQTRLPPTRAPGTASIPPSMPPPTNAPWAKDGT